MPTPTVTEVEEFKVDIDASEEFVNSSDLTFNTRLGGTKQTINGLSFNAATGTVTTFSAASQYTLLTEWVDEGGIIFRPKPSALPIGPAVFDIDDWFVAQNPAPTTYATADALRLASPNASINTITLEAYHAWTPGVDEPKGRANWARNGTGTPSTFNADGSIVDALGGRWEVSEEVIACPMLGATGDGIANDTVAMLAFYTRCVFNEQAGHIPAGTYKIDLGALVLDNAHIETRFPNITTDGHELVTFTNSADIDAAFLTFKNGTATSGAGKFWEGGSHGGVKFQRVVGSAANTNQHGLVLSGFNNTKFGLMGSTSIGGHGIFMPQNLYLGNNPDPYHIASCKFGGVEHLFSGGYAFYNDNFVGMSLCEIDFLRVIESGGVFHGMGAGNILKAVSAGSNAGWGIGDDTSAAGGASSRFRIFAAEFDDQQYGIQAGRAANSDFDGVRFVHRYRFGPLNPAGAYWPEVAVNIGSVSAHDLNFEIIHRIESGGAKIDVGDFVDYNSSGNISNVKIYNRVIDNAAFGFTSSDQYSNYSQSALVRQTEFSGRDIINNLGENISLARAPTSYAIPSSGFGSSVVEFSTTLRDTYSNYDSGTYTYTAPSNGVYTINARLNVNLTAGQRVRVGTLLNSGGQGGFYYYAPVTGVNTVIYNYSVIASIGDSIQITADNNSGGALNLTTILGSSDNILSVERSE